MEDHGSARASRAAQGTDSLAAPEALPSAARRDRFDRAKMPLGIQRLSVDTRGYPVPWFVDKAAPYIDGNPDFRIMDGAHLKLAIREKRCWVCGMKLRAGAFAFLAGPMCGINRTSAEPPSHVECARWSARACPFLSFPKRVRDERNLPPDRTVAGVGITRNPGVAMVWICEDYETWRPPNGGILFQLGEPSSVEWVREGREATQAEVMHSVETGLPALLRIAASDPAPANACFELGMMTARFLEFVLEDASEPQPRDPQVEGESSREASK